MDLKVICMAEEKIKCKHIWRYFWLNSVDKLPTLWVCNKCEEVKQFLEKGDIVFNGVFETTLG